MSDTVLEFSGLDAFYGDFQALFDVNMAIPAGEIIAVIGANGAGKSTLMRSAVGLTKNKPDQIVFKGQAIGNLGADKIAQMGLALVPEGRQLFQSLSVEENLLLGGKTGRAGDWNLTKVYELFPVLEERAKQPSTSLSGGQQQMVAIGRALMANPEVLLLDEISLGLAPVVINTIYEVLPKIVVEGMTAMIVEQDISRALSISSQVFCLQEGRITLQGSTPDVDRSSITKAYFGVSA